MTFPLIIFDWSGEAMVPMARFARMADEHFVVGERYRMEVIEERSAISHSHYFASIHESWLNLPEMMTAQFPTQEHLRKYALIKAGFADKNSIVCTSKAEAIRIAAFIKPIDDYSIVTVDGRVITRYTAQSQSLRAMGKEKFQDSKTKVLDIISAMIGTTKETLMQQV